MIFCRSIIYIIRAFGLLLWRASRAHTFWMLPFPRRSDRKPDPERFCRTGLHGTQGADPLRAARAASSLHSQRPFPRAPVLQPRGDSDHGSSQNGARRIAVDRHATRPVRDAICNTPRRPRPTLGSADVDTRFEPGLIDSSVVNVALPRMQAELDTGFVTSQWIVNGYMLMLASLILFGGLVGDAFGQRRTFIFGLAGFASASVACGLAPNEITLVAFRCLQGAAAAFLIPSSLALIGGAFSGEDRGRAVGTWSALTAQCRPRYRWPGSGSPVPRLDQLRADRGRDRCGIVWIALGATRCSNGHPARLAADAVEPADDPSAPVSRSPVCGRERDDACFVRFTHGLAVSTAVRADLRLRLLGRGGRGRIPPVLGDHRRRVAARRRDGQRIGSRAMLVAGSLVTAVGYVVFALCAERPGFWLGFFPGLAVTAIGMTLCVAPLTTTILDLAPDDLGGSASGVNTAAARWAAWSRWLPSALRSAERPFQLLGRTRSSKPIVRQCGRRPRSPRSAH